MIHTLRGIRDRELHALDAAIEPVAARAVVRRNGSAAVLADVAAIVGREDHRQRGGNDPFTDLLPVGIQSHLTALSKPSAVIAELHAHLVVASRKWARRLGVEVLHAAQ